MTPSLHITLDPDGELQVRLDAAGRDQLVAALQRLKGGEEVRLALSGEPPTGPRPVAPDGQAVVTGFRFILGTSDLEESYLPHLLRTAADA